MRCTPRQAPPSGSPGVVVTTFSRLWATRRPYTVLSRPCPGRTSHPSRTSTPATGGGCDAPPEAVQAPKWVDFPAAAQVLQVRRTTTIKGRKHVEVAYPGQLPPYDRCPARGHRRRDPRALGNREPTPRRSQTSSSTKTATSYAPTTAHRSWPHYATWPPGLIRLAHGTQAAIASTTRSLSRRPKRAIKLLTRPTT